MASPDLQTAQDGGAGSFDAFAADYEGALNQGLRFTGEGKDFFAEGRVRWLRQRLAALGVTPGRCLDYGCGTGTGSHPLLGEFNLETYLGYDPSVESIHVARQEAAAGPAGFTADSAGIPEGSFDLAFTNGVFHHIPPHLRQEAVALVWRALQPGGWFAFWENNRWNPVVHFLMSRVPFDHDAQMLFPFQARRLLRAQGFEIVSTDSVFIFPALLKCLRPLESSLCKLPLGGQYLVLARKPVKAGPFPS